MITGEQKCLTSQSRQVFDVVSRSLRENIMNDWIRWMTNPLMNVVSIISNDLAWYLRER